MHLVQLLLPLSDNEGNRFSSDAFAHVRHTLTEHFGGLTAFVRAPADGLWKSDQDQTVRDEIVVYEVLAPALDRDWWRRFRGQLEVIFRQEEILVRANAVELL